MTTMYEALPPSECTNQQASLGIKLSPNIRDVVSLKPLPPAMQQQAIAALLGRTLEVCNTVFSLPR